MKQTWQVYVNSKLKIKLFCFFVLFVFNNFILRWYCLIAEANRNQPLITINMVKIVFFLFLFYLRHVEADTKVMLMWQPYTDMSIPHRYQNRFIHPQGE